MYCSISRKIQGVYLSTCTRSIVRLVSGICPTEGVWAGYGVQVMHFSVESSCHGVETKVATPIWGPQALTFVLVGPQKSEPSMLFSLARNKCHSKSSEFDVCSH